MQKAAREKGKCPGQQQGEDKHRPHYQLVAVYVVVACRLNRQIQGHQRKQAEQMNGAERAPEATSKTKKLDMATTAITPAQR